MALLILALHARAGTDRTAVERARQQTTIGNLFGQRRTNMQPQKSTQSLPATTRRLVVRIENKVDSVSAATAFTNAVISSSEV